VRRGQQTAPQPSSSSSSSSSSSPTTSSSATTSSASSPDDPYLSIILAARNDGHEGNFLARLQNCLDQIIVLSRRLPQLSAEGTPPPSTSVLEFETAPLLWK
jgi:hypothetical protein